MTINIRISSDFIIVLLPEPFGPANTRSRNSGVEVLVDDNGRYCDYIAAITSTLPSRYFFTILLFSATTT